MVQTIPATEVAADHIEEAHDLFDAYAGDGVIDLEEIRTIRQALDRAVHSADRANLSRAIGVCVMRGGFGGQRHSRLMRQWEELHELAPCDGDDPLTAA